MSIILNQDQSRALRLLKGKKNVFLTGGAGTGKTTLINAWKKDMEKPIPVVCSTGMAATLIPNAKTFHSFFGLGPINPDQQVCLAIGRAAKNGRVIENLTKNDTIIIDEVSMISGFLLNCANTIAKKVRGNSSPFGGMRIIAVGDFYQLPPVKTDVTRPLDWVFKSKAWKSMDFQTYELKQFMRTTETEFLEVLSNIRQGNLNKADEKFLLDRMCDMDDEIEGLRLFPKKESVRKFNLKKLKELPGKMHSFETEYTADNEVVLEKIKETIPVDEVLNLKIDAKVMIRSNCRGGTYANGTMGFVHEISEKFILVKKEDGQVVKVYKFYYTMEDAEGNVVASARAFPIVPAYSISIHKSQGQSLDKAVVDLRGLFESGQAYTALSRLTNSDGLKILGFDIKSFKIDKKVVKFYQG